MTNHQPMRTNSASRCFFWVSARVGQIWDWLRGKGDVGLVRKTPPTDRASVGGDAARGSRSVADLRADPTTDVGGRATNQFARCFFRSSEMKTPQELCPRAS
jgi:hypothetical protein